MARLPDEAVSEFQALWKKHYGEELADEQAEIKANEVFRVLAMALTEPRKESPASEQSGEPEAGAWLRKMRAVTFAE